MGLALAQGEQKKREGERRKAHFEISVSVPFWPSFEGSFWAELGAYSAQRRREKTVNIFAKFSSRF